MDIHPFIFSNRCPKCLSKDYKFIDIHGDEHKEMIFVTYQMQCNKCGSKFNLKWIKDEFNTDMTAYFIDEDYKDEFVSDILDYAKSTRRKLV